MKNKGNTTLIAVVLVVVVLLGFWWFTTGRYAGIRRPVAVNTFAECVERGYQVAATYPRRCVTPNGDVYTESLLTASAFDSSAYDPRVNTYSQVFQPYTPMQGNAYVSYPVARATATSTPSRYIVPVDSYSSASRTSTYYYMDNSYPYPNYNPSYPYIDNNNQGGCYVGGCNNQICSDQPNLVSACDFRPEYACFQNARCERQASGQCGWTQTRELSSCLMAAY